LVLCAASVYDDLPVEPGGTMPLIAATDPSFGNMARQMSKIMDQLHRGYSTFAPSEVWTPSVNLYEVENAYIVCVDLAGVHKEKIEITVERNMLKLRGHRGVPTNSEEGQSEPQNRRIRVHLMEIDHGSFSREVELPKDVSQDHIAAHYRDGLLWIELPKKN
jgi:HSP20 family protein